MHSIRAGVLACAVAGICWLLIPSLGDSSRGWRARDSLRRAPAQQRAAAPAWRDDADAAEFASGTIPLDADGQPIYAHEGCFAAQDDGLLLWYGAGPKHENGGAWASDTVRLYTSRDLSSWRNRGRVFANSSIPDLGVPPPYRIGAVRVLYNAARRQYVMVLALSTLDYAYSALGFATSVGPLGPFKWELASPGDGLPTADIAAAVDDNGADAYLVRNLGNVTVISRLKDDYLGTTGACTTLPATGSPALFKSGGRWYLLASPHKGWQPGAPQLFVSNGSYVCGASWSKLPRPASGRGADTTFDSSPAFVHTHRWRDGSELQIYAGDRWNAKGEGGVGNASYVFLPLLPAGGAPAAFTMIWLERWRLGDYKPVAPS